MPANEVPEVFTVESYRFVIDPEADLLTQILKLGGQIVGMERSHTSGGRVCAITVEMERPITQEGG